MRHFKLLTLSLALALAAGCDSDAKAPELAAGDEAKASPPKASPELKPDAEPEPEPEAKPEDSSPASNTDYLEIRAMHSPAKPGDPAVMRIVGIKVVTASFDPKKLEAASAEIELDMGSLTSNSPDRDEHLKSDDFLDIAKFPVAQVSITKVRKTESGYLANAHVSSRGFEADWELPFEVLDAGDNSVRIKGSFDFPRSKFKIGDEGDLEDKLSASWDITLRADS